ncbi:MAG: hypothetical protein WCF90_08290 [Methanomicrobiales archaeon]
MTGKKGTFLIQERHTLATHTLAIQVAIPLPDQQATRQALANSLSCITCCGYNPDFVHALQE